jgi:DNA-binding NarL/FixJ family response regulator
MIRILLVDDHPPLRFGMRLLLEREPDLTIVGEVGSGQEALAAIAHHPPDVVILDCQMPDMDGVAVARAIQKQGIETRILALSSYDDPEYVYGMVGAGALGYLLKSESPSVIIEAVKSLEHKSWFSPSVAKRLVQAIRRDSPNPFTPREQEVLEGLGRGWNNPTIAAHLFISDRTVGQHVQNIYGKLGVKGRTEAVVEAMRRGWLQI